MPLPRPGAVRPVQQAAPVIPETIPELSAVQEDLPPLPPLGGEAPAAMDPMPPQAAVSPLYATETVQAEPPVLQAAAPIQEEAVTEIVDYQKPAPVHAVEPVAPVQAQAPAAAVMAVDNVTNIPTHPQAAAPYVHEETPAHQGMAPAAPQAGGVMSMGAEQVAGMGFGFEPLELGVGSFPSVSLKDDIFKTSDEEKLGSNFCCIIFGWKTKWIVKSNDTNSSEFKYSFDKIHDTNGKPLAAEFDIWRAKGVMPGDPIYKEYRDVLVQLVDVASKTSGQVVMLSVPKTSLPRLKGHQVTVQVTENKNLDQIITQVYAAAKVTSTKVPFHPWGFRKAYNIEQVFG